MAEGRVHIGIGGWVFEPWRGTFYPDDLPQSKELGYASSRLTSIEINATFYGSQKPESFRRWASEVPDGFVFSVKGPRFATNRKVLAEAGPSIDRFVESGITELGPKLGPLLWQLAATKRFERDDMAAFLRLLPKEAGGLRLRHVIEARHPSFMDKGFVALLREANVAVVAIDHPEHPMLADVTADFVYMRLENSSEDEPAGYASKALDAWAERIGTWRKGGVPDDLPRVADAPKATPRDVYAYVIAGAKVRAPHGAMALIERTKG